MGRSRRVLRALGIVVGTGVLMTACASSSRTTFADYTDSEGVRRCAKAQAFMAEAADGQVRYSAVTSTWTGPLCSLEQGSLAGAQIISVTVELQKRALGKWVRCGPEEGWVEFVQPRATAGGDAYCGPGTYRVRGSFWIRDGDRSWGHDATTPEIDVGS